MRALISQHSRDCLQPRGDPFHTLARSIVGQQISVKAAASVWARVEVFCAGRVDAPRVAHATVQDLRACGLSERKAEYLRALGLAFVSGRIDPPAWAELPDEKVIAALVQERGIGRWTAEMFLIFNLLRPNVLPLDDLGLLKGISVNYFSGEPVSRSDAREVAANWEPWRTVGTWYLWRSLDPLPVEY